MTSAFRRGYRKHTETDEDLVNKAFVKAERAGLNIVDCYLAATKALSVNYPYCTPAYVAATATDIILRRRSKLLIGLQGPKL